MQLKSRLLFFFFYCCIGCHRPISSVNGALNDEVSVLLSIKASLIDPLNQLKDWNLSSNEAANSSAHCSWTGVSCNSIGAVEKLDLSGMNLSGRISDDFQLLKSLTFLNLCCNGFSSFLPKSMANLSWLRSLDVSQNFFVGSFPRGFGNADGLTYLNASGNNFVGDLPDDLGNATRLATIDLRGSFFQGSIPVSYKSLQKLEFLGLSGNNLTGRIPPELGQLSSMETMIIGYNEFEGGIPAEFGNLTNLKYLDMAIANLGGQIPVELSGLNQLNTIFLFKNKFQGKIPPAFGNLTSLIFLDISDNMLSGEIPFEVAALKNLQLLNLMCNKLIGPIPSGLGKLTQLQVLELWNNSLSGTLPSDLGKNAPLQWLDISSNSLSGEIPETLCSKGNLTKFIVFNNRFTGSISTILTECSSLVRVRMQNNLLSGTIPMGLGKLGALQRLELANNNLTGEIPDDLASSTSLSFIDLSGNHLQSSLPSTILSIPNLQTFMAANNRLEGGIPDQFQDCPFLSVLDLSSNCFTGTIPASIASCEKLVTLNLRDNQLTGGIPESIAMMPTLAILDLSNNSLTGKIPSHFGSSPALETLNVSYNKLWGPVPANGILSTINPSDLVGNSGLCGSVLPPCSRNSLNAPGHSSLRTKHVLAAWMVGIATVLVVGITVLGAQSLYKRWYSNGSCFEDSFEMSNGEWPWRLMAFQRLAFTSNDILACIKESNVIGMGATGIVYKAELPRSSTVVAVKKLWRSSTDVEAENGDNLVGEVNLLGKLRHRNIVRLLGFLHNDKDAMMVCEYMQNGSLGEALHGKQAGRLLVDWVSRYNIAVGVAHGIAYLHHDCHPPVIHRDVKSNNILLDANLEARIADFGLAKMMIKKNQTVSVVAGSYGYIAPEYGYTLKVDEKSDIYSYGVVLLELLTGKRPTDPEFGDSTDVVEWIRGKIRNNRPLEDVLDPNVGGNCNLVQEEMLLALRVAVLCTAKHPKDRPSMRDVITMLGEAKPRRKSSSNNGGSAINKDNSKPVFSTSPVNGLL
ncbi:hypothetical protein Nepgr_004398 [Nepenthes gracilis]|uniref:non-specific serine/threonine protein kinase n=1 Tax=Nepenthes gracilis TaxID=150966 RepID=A0AAD3S1J5_NEPGR|nr:hypothetical protein Nepgr_004398 [Nepenthes gracilis]